jgi:sugar (pentulose or hexulose) kinase
MTTFFLGIDLGATFIKGAVLDVAKNCVRASIRRPFPGFILNRPTMIKEVAAEEIVSAFMLVLNELLAEESSAGGLFLSSQMHGLIFVDARGQAQSPYISWQDQRALDVMPGTTKRYYDDILTRVEEFRGACGNELRPSLPLCALRVLALQRALPDHAVPASLTDFLLAHLRNTGVVSDVTNAAASGLLDLATQTWHAPSLKALELDGLPWPDVVPAGTPLGEAHVAGRTLTVFAGLGDQQAALLGVGLQTNELSLNVATGSQVSRLVDELDLQTDVQTRPFLSGRWLRTVTHLPAGRALNALVALFAELTDADDTECLWRTIIEKVDATPNTDVHANICFFETAIGNRGSFTELHMDNLRIGHIFRAAFESMAETYDSVARRVWPERDWQNLAFSGGLLSKIEPLRDAVQRRLGVSARLCETGEDALEGLLRLAQMTHKNHS